MNNILTQFPWLDKPIRIVIYFIAAMLIAFILRQLAYGLIKLGRLAPHGRKPSLERQKTLQSLISSTINLVAILFALIASFGLFVDANTVAWVTGLLSAAIGFGARLIIGDYLSGLSFLFEDTFAVGEKIEILSTRAIEGVVEKINLRTTMLRSPQVNYSSSPTARSAVFAISAGANFPLPISRSRSKVQI